MADDFVFSGTQAFTTLERYIRITKIVVMVTLFLERRWYRMYTLLRRYGNTTMVQTERKSITNTLARAFLIPVELSERLHSLAEAVSDDGPGLDPFRQLASDARRCVTTID